MAGGQVTKCGFQAGRGKPLMIYSEWSREDFIVLDSSPFLCEEVQNA